MNISSKDLADNPVVRTATAEITSLGGAVAVDGVTANLLPGSVNETITLSLAVTRHQLPSLRRAGFAISAEGVILTFDTTRLSTTPEIELRIDTGGSADPSTVIWVADSDDRVWPLLTYPAEDGRALVGRIPTAFFQRGPERRIVDRENYSLRIHTLARRAEGGAAPLTTSVQMFNRSTGVWGPMPAGFNPRGKRLALLVHGIMGSLQDFTVLAPQLAALNGGGIPFYDYIIGFQYSSNAPLEIIANAMIAGMAPNIASAASVDLIAHSMGNLVSRWAMEQGNGVARLGGITRYLALGGPHAGVPFGSRFIREFLQLAAYFYPGCEPCLLDLLTSGYRGTPSPFLTRLNTPAPNPARTRYYSLAGNDWYDYTWTLDGYSAPVGEITFAWYLEVCGIAHATEDGLVATWSAQAPILAVKDPRWKPNPVMSVTHHGLIADQTAINQIITVIRQWQLAGEAIADLETSVN